jgi:uroporphyrinogen III methyltransferase/synthase
MAHQRSISAPLEDIAATVREAGLGTPLLTVVGQVATLREHIAWFETRPLFGKRVLVTRTREQSSALSDLLRREGAVPVELPTLEIVPVSDAAAIRRAVDDLRESAYDYCIFTSVNAVDHFWHQLDAAGRDARSFGRCQVAAIGEATGDALRQRGVRPDIMPASGSSAALLAEFASEHTLVNERVLFPKAAETLDIITNGLRDLGAIVDEVILYESRAPAAADAEALQLLRDGRIDVATFASSSSVKNLASLLGDDFRRLDGATIACIGPVTASTARECGLAVDVEPMEHTIPALVAALRAHFARPS